VDSELDQPEGQRPGAHKPEDQQHDPGLGPTVRIPSPPPADTAPWTPSWDAPGVQPPAYRPLVSASDDTDPSIPPVPAYPDDSPQDAAPQPSERPQDAPPYPGARSPTALAYPGSWPQDAPPRPGAQPQAGPPYPRDPSAQPQPPAPPYPRAQPPYPGSPPPGGPPYPGAQPPTAFAYPGASPQSPGTPGAQAYPGAQAQGYPGAQAPAGYRGNRPPGGAYPGAQPPAGLYPGAQSPAPPYPGAQQQPPAPPYAGAQQPPAPPYAGAQGQSPAPPYPGAYGGASARPTPAYPGAPAQPPAPPYPGAQPPGGGYRGAQQQAGGYPGAQPPYPYPGQQVPAGYPGYYQQQPPPRKSRRGLITGIVVGAVVVIAAAVTAVVLLLPKNVAPTTMALKSGQAVAASSGLTLTGSIAGGDATVSVTRAGTVGGSYSQNGNPVSRITINGVTYLKAPATFWRSTSVGATSATQAGGKWAKAPADAVNMGFDSFTPAQVSRVLEHAGKNPRVTRITLGGTQVIRLVVGTTTYYIATASPYRLIRIDGVSNTKRYSFDVTELSAAAIGPVFAALHADAQALQGAIDPEAIVLPLEKIKFGPDCSAAVSCHVSSRVSVTTANAPKVIVTMTVDFSAVENGKPFATCLDRTPTTSFATVSQSCGVGGSVWSGWFNSHTGNFTTWAHARFEVTVNSASDIDALQGELNQEQHVG
jgi:hypothetical protein